MFLGVGTQLWQICASIAQVHHGFELPQVHGPVGHLLVGNEIWHHMVNSPEVAQLDLPPGEYIQIRAEHDLLHRDEDRHRLLRGIAPDLRYSGVPSLELQPRIGPSFWFFGRWIKEEVRANLI